MSYGFQSLETLVDRALLASSAKDRLEEDQLGIQYAWNAGYDPKGFIAFLDSMSLKESPNADRFFQTKPDTGRRLLNAFSEIEYLPAKDNTVLDSAEFRRAKERLRRN